MNRDRPPPVHVGSVGDGTHLTEYFGLALSVSMHRRRRHISFTIIEATQRLTIDNVAK